MERMRIIDIDDISYRVQRLLNCQFNNSMKVLEEYFSCKIIFNEESDTFVFMKDNYVLELRDIDYIMMDPKGKLSVKKHVEQLELTDYGYSSKELEDFWNDDFEVKFENNFNINHKIYAFSKFFMRKYYKYKNDSASEFIQGYVQNEFYNDIKNFLPKDFKHKYPVKDLDFMWIADRLQNILNKEEKVKLITNLNL